MYSFTMAVKMMLLQAVLLTSVVTTSAVRPASSSLPSLLFFSADTYIDPFALNAPRPYYLTTIQPGSSGYQSISIKSPNSTLLFRLSQNVFFGGLSQDFSPARQVLYLHSTLMWQPILTVMQTLTVQLPPPTTSTGTAASPSVVIGDMIIAPEMGDPKSAMPGFVEALFYVREFSDWYAFSVTVANDIGPDNFVTVYLDVFNNFSAVLSGDVAPPAVYRNVITLGPRIGEYIYVSDARVAVNDEASLFYVTVDFVTPSQSDWLLTYNLTDNTIISNVTFPDVSQWQISIPYACEIAYSAIRRTLFAAVTYENQVPPYNVFIAAIVVVDPVSGRNKTIVPAQAFPTTYSNVRVRQTLDDERGLWWFILGASASNMSDVTIVGVNIDAGTIDTVFSVGADDNLDVLGMYVDV